MKKKKYSITSPPGPLSKGEGESVISKSINGNESNYGYITTDDVTWFNLKENVKTNRKNQTEAEQVLWEAIRNNKLGFRFRRQHVIHSYIPDFVCIPKKLIIKIDGEIHEYQKEEDEERTRFLNNIGYHIMRFKNEEIKKDINSVLSKIIEKL